VAVEIRWTQTRAADDPDGTEPSGPGAGTGDDVRPVVEEWLTAAGGAFEIESVDVDDSEVTVDLRSADPPPPIEDLTARIDERYGLVVPVVVNWTQRTTLSGSDGDERLRRQVEAAAGAWADDQQDVVVTGVTVDDGSITIALSGPTPGDVGTLRDAVTDIAGAGTAVDVWYTARRLLPAPP
jgi:hypothetical protein